MSTNGRSRVGSWVVAGAAVVIATGAMAFTLKGSSGVGRYQAGIPEVHLPEVHGVTTETLVAPPFVPAALDRDYATKVVVKLEVVEKEMEIEDGVKYKFWTFGGTVPGKFIRVREGDEVELHLINPAGNMMPHNIDLHAVTGPHGGGQATITLPGKESVLRFRAIKPGLYVYHCAMTGMVGMHIANGMYGMILVEPKEGLPKVDHEFYVMQGDFYTQPVKGEPGVLQFDHDKAVKAEPDFVLFNGRVGSLMGEHSLKVKKGETVRLFIGNGGPNLVSSFHIIGEMFDNVYTEGGSMVNHDVQTTLIPAGGATIVEFRADQPGSYHMIDHSIFRATELGAMGDIEVSGPDDGTLFGLKE